MRMDSSSNSSLRLSFALLHLASGSPVGAGEEDPEGLAPPQAPETELGEEEAVETTEIFPNIPLIALVLSRSPHPTSSKHSLFPGLAALHHA